MKKITLILLTVLAAFAAEAQLQNVALVGNTIISTTNSATITIPGVCTNAPYTAINTNFVIIGDTVPIAFLKVSNNIAYLQFQIASWQTNLQPVFVQSNTWANSWFLATNGLPIGARSYFVNSNGVADYRVWNSNSVYYVTPP